MLKIFFQFVRFLGIGFLNTAVDFAVFNFFASLTGIYVGIGASLLNVMSFSMAVFHSYFWNKYWTFAKGNEEGLVQNLGKFISAAIVGVGVLGASLWGARVEYGFMYFLSLLAILAIFELILWKTFRLAVPGGAYGSRREFILFVVVSLIGTVINSGIVGGVTAFLKPLFGLNQNLWTNLVKAGATGVSLIWNFAGYKIFVFKK